MKAKADKEYKTDGSREEASACQQLQPHAGKAKVGRELVSDSADQRKFQPKSQQTKIVPRSEAVWPTESLSSAFRSTRNGGRPGEPGPGLMGAILVKGLQRGWWKLQDPSPMPEAYN